MLQLVNRAVAVGCRNHYTPAQQRAVYLSYASNLFVDVLTDMETWLIEREATPLAFAQVDPKRARLRALFVAPQWHGHGFGSLMLARIEAVARERGLTELHGSMSMNAIGFYIHGGFVPVGTPEVTPMFGEGVKVQTMRKKLT